MNQFKEDVFRELQDLKFSSEKRKAIAQKARGRSKSRRNVHWQYRIVLATFTLCAIALSYLFSQDDEKQVGSQQATVLQQETDTFSIWTFLENDWVRGILLFCIFLFVSFIVKRRLKNKRIGLPKCVECGEKWSLKQVQKLYWKNGQITCPHCGKNQYRTKKSMQLAGLLNLPIPFMVFVHLFFDNFFIGIGFYLAGTFTLILQITPYLFELQEEDPMNEPLW